MDFNLSDEQRMLTESVSRFVQGRYDLERRKEYLASPTSYCAENWRMLADLGVTGLALPSELGGFEGSPADIAVVMEQLGKGLVVEPVTSSSVIAARLLAASPAQAEVSAAIAAGESRIAIAFADPPASRKSPAEPLHWDVAGDGFRLSGVKTMAVQSVGADAVIFPCANPGGFAAFLIDPREISGIVRKDYLLMDGSLASEFCFSDTEVAGPALLDVTLDDWISAKAWGDIATCAEMLGVMGRLLDETAEYLRTRKQFGVPIGTFQALQHKMARMLMDYEKARALLFRAAASSKEKELPGTTRDCSRFTGRAAIDIAEGCIHLHGGMGVTDELFAGHALKRLHVLRAYLSLGRGDEAKPGGWRDISRAAGSPLKA